MEYCKKRGRAYVTCGITMPLVSLSGQALAAEGEIEIAVPSVGPVKFMVVAHMRHDIILGWDQLHRYTWSVIDNHEKLTLRWGRARFEIDYVNESPAGVEVAHVDAGFLTSALARHLAVFGQPGQLPFLGLPELTIKTEKGVVVHQRPYRTALNKRAIIDAEIDKMLEMGIIRPSSSPFASPVTLVPKKDGTTRFCIDYRALNAVTVKDRYPLPLVQDIFDQVGGSAVFSTMDMRSGYWQLPVAPESIHKTAFVCHRGQYEFLRLPFGLANAPSVYQRAMNHVLEEYLGKFVLVFLDDIVIYSPDEETHLKHVNLVLQKLEAAGLTVKDSKCQWAKSNINLLGYVISENGISPQPEKTRAIAELTAPQDITELRRFLGMTGYYRQLIPNYARTAGMGTI